MGGKILAAGVIRALPKTQLIFVLYRNAGISGIYCNLIVITITITIAVNAGNRIVLEHQTRNAKTEFVSETRSPKIVLPETRKSFSLPIAVVSRSVAEEAKAVSRCIPFTKVGSLWQSLPRRLGQKATYIS